MRWMGLALLVGCAPRVSVEVLEPAAKTLPQHFKTVVTLERGGADNRLEKDAAVEAEEAMATVVSRSPRFEVVALTKEQAVNFDALERTLPWDTVDAITSRVGAQGVVALESAESTSTISEDSRKDSYVDDKGKKHITITWVATRTTVVKTAWKVYDGDNQKIVDDLTVSARTSWDNEGSTAAEARNGLPDADTGVLDLAYETGEDYGRRIAPTWIKVSRVYYPSGSDRMANAKDAITSGKIKPAADIWEKVAEGNDPKLAAKANFNLGVAWEGRGNLRKAIDHVNKADRVLSNGKTRSYVDLLRQRLAEKKKLKKQMAPVRGDTQNP